MGRLAATEFGADWVIHSDADEFWWPRGESLKDVLDVDPGALRRSSVRCSATSCRVPTTGRRSPSA